MQKQVIQQTATPQQVQQQVTQQQVQLSHLLELPAGGMDDEIRKALDENPALEREESAEEGADTTLATADLLQGGAESGYVRRSQEGPDLSAEERLAYTETDADALQEQIALLPLTEKERKIMDYIAGSLNSYGYLEKDDHTLADEIAFGLYLDVGEDEVRRLVAVFQTLEPAGIGARDLRECLLLQLNGLSPSGMPTAPFHPSPVREGEDTGRAVDESESERARRNALRIVRDAWDDYAARRLERVRKALGITASELQEAEAQIRRCNPRPGSALTAATQSEVQTITPDFVLSVDEYGSIDVALSHWQEPRLKVRQEYVEIVERMGALAHPSRTEQEAYVYAKDKVDRATAYLNNLMRRRGLLMGTMREIARRQHDFFTHEDDDALLRPMRLQDVAEHLEVDISTVSRAANSKYVQTAYGIYPLRHFFNAQGMEKDGEIVSNVQLKIALRELLEAEDPQHRSSDEHLARLLQEKGYKIARRTVAKYRLQMGFAPGKKHSERATDSKNKSKEQAK